MRGITLASPLSRPLNAARLFVIANNQNDFIGFGCL